MWRHWNSHTLLIRVLNSTSTLEKSLTASLKGKHSFTMVLFVCTLCKSLCHECLWQLFFFFYNSQKFKRTPEYIKKEWLNQLLYVRDSRDCSPPGSSVQGVLQARILEWVAMPSSRGSSWPRDRTWVSCIAGDSLPSEPPGKLSEILCNNKKK